MTDRASEGRSRRSDDSELAELGRRVTLGSRAWALEGVGAPAWYYGFYLAKLAIWFLAWCFFCSFTPGLGGLRSLAWWSEPVAFQKAVLWTLAFEGAGLGGGSGPMCGYTRAPYFSAGRHFVRPGTMKMPFKPGLPLVGGDRRTWFDVALYVVHYGFLLRALIAPSVTPSLVAPIVCLLLLLGLTDKTLFLSARGDHYWPVLVSFSFLGTDWIAGSKVVWLAIWFWAATSKLSPHFPYVVAAMQSNSPLTPKGLRRRFYRDVIDDLRPSSLAVLLARVGTVFEFGIPAVLICSRTAPAGVTMAVLGAMVLFHAFIVVSVPVGVPLEWNVMMVYGGLFLFWAQRDVDPLRVHSPLLVAVLSFNCIVVPLVGALRPATVSFLCAMRYYAGIWPFGVWMLKKDALRKIEGALGVALPRSQLIQQGLGASDIDQVVAKGLARRAMHLQGRLIQFLLPEAVDDVGAYDCIDGETICGSVVGWRFGDGHLHGMQLLRAIGRQLALEPGEMRCIFVEGAALGSSTLRWTIADAATPETRTGAFDTRRLLDVQPFGGAAERA